jgi:hypothetical protein
MKQDLGINGEHTQLGRELNMAEFKGYTVAEIKNIKDMIKEMKEEQIREMKEFRCACADHRKGVYERMNAHSKKIDDLQAFKNKVLGIAILVGSVAGVVGNFVLTVLMKLKGG